MSDAKQNKDASAAPRPSSRRCPELNLGGSCSRHEPTTDGQAGLLPSQGRSRIAR